MKLETLRLLTAWLDDPTTGVNAELAGVPRVGADVLPADVALITDETQDIDAALGRMPDAEREPERYPCLLLSQTADVTGMEPHVKPGPIRDAGVEVLIRYGVLESEAVTGTQAGDYTMRAVMRSLDAFKASPENDRVLNNIYVMACEAMEPVPVWQSQKDAICTAALRTRWRVRDTAPLGV